MPTGRPTPPEAEGHLGIFKRFADVPPHYHLGQYNEAFELRDVWSEYDAATGMLTTDSERYQQTIKRALWSWDIHMMSVGRHPALADPEHVERWCQSLLDGTDAAARPGRDRSPRTAYIAYWSHIAAFYEWLTNHVDYPHVYNPVLMAAAEYSDGASGQIWSNRIERRGHDTGGAL